MSKISGYPSATTANAADYLLGDQSGATKTFAVSTLFGSPSSGQIVGWGSAATPITVGSGLTLSAGTLSATGGSGSGTVNSASANQLGYYAGTGTAISGLTLGTGLSISGSTLNATGGSGSGTVGSGTAGQIAIYATSGTSVSGVSVSGDAAISTGGAITVTKTNGVAFAASATTDATNASNIASGTLAAARGGAGSISGILKANGSGVVSGAVSGTDYQGPITLTTTGTSGAATLVSGTLNIPQYTGGGGGGSPGGSTGQLQYNSSGAFAGAANVGYDGTNGALQFAAIADPGSPAAGDVWLSSTTGALTVARAGTSAVLPVRHGGLIFSAKGSGTALNNPTSATSIFGAASTTLVGTRTIPAGTLKAGSVVQVHFIASYQTPISGNVTVTVLLGSTPIMSNSVNLSSNCLFVLAPATVYVLTTGSTGSAYGYAFCVVPFGTSMSLTSSGFDAFTPVTLNTTIDQALDIQVMCGTSNAGNNFKLIDCSVYIY